MTVTLQFETVTNISRHIIRVSERLLTNEWEILNGYDFVCYNPFRRPSRIFCLSSFFSESKFS